MAYKKLKPKGCVSILIFVLFFIINVNGQKPDTISLRDLLAMPMEKLVELPVTTSAKYEQRAWEASAKVIVITKTMIESRGYFDLTDIIRELPYFQLQSEYGHWMKGGIVNLRGHRSGDSGNNKFLILIDGVRISDDAAEGIFLGLNSFPLFGVKQVEVVYGPNSTLYGSNAYTGMINVITEDTQLAYGGYTYGSFNTHRIYGGIIQPLNTKGHVSIQYSSYSSEEQDPRDKSVTYKNRHIYPTHPYTERFYHGTRNNFINISAALRGFSIKYLMSNIEASETYGCNPDLYVSEYSTVTAPKYQIILSQYTAKVTPKVSLILSGNYKQQELDPRTANLYTADLGRTGSINFNDSTVLIDSLYAYGGRKYYFFRTISYSAASNLIYQPNSRLKLIGGVEAFNINGIPIISEGKGGKPITTLSQRKKWEHYFNIYGLYGESGWRLSDNMVVSLGGRFDISTIYGNMLVPRLSVIKRHNEFVYKFIYSQGYLSPSVTQRYFESITTFSWIRPNPNLKPERNSSFEIDGTWRVDQIQLSANAFYNNIINGIVESFQTGDSVDVPIGSEVYHVPLIQSLNISKGYRVGFSFDANCLISPNLSFVAAYSYLSGADYVKDQTIRLSNNLVSKHSLQGSFTYFWEKISITSAFIWQSKRRILSPHINTLYSSFVDADGYINFNPSFIVNMNIRFNDIRNGVSAFLHIKNLFNHEYYGQTINANWGSPKILQDLRRIDVGLEIIF